MSGRGTSEIEAMLIFDTHIVLGATLQASCLGKHRHWNWRDPWWPMSMHCWRFQFFKDGIEGSTVQAMNLDVLNTMHHAVSLWFIYYCNPIVTCACLDVSVLFFWLGGLGSGRCEFKDKVAFSFQHHIVVALVWQHVETLTLRSSS